MNFIKKILLLDNLFFDLTFRKIYKMMLSNDNFSIICNNCIGGVIYHSLGKKFLSPTINLYITPSDFVKFCSNLKYYLALELNEVSTEFDYPVGRLGDILIYFKHYNNFSEAKEKWNERKLRINFNNIFIFMTDRVTAITTTPYRCSEIIVQKFDKLPFKNKVCFVSDRTLNKYQSTCFLKKFEKDGVVDIITNFFGVTGKRGYMLEGRFKFINFINGKGFN